MSENEFIDRAVEYRRRAKGSRNEAEKRSWLMLAESWLLMLRVAERQGTAELTAGLHPESRVHNDALFTRQSSELIH